MDYYVKNVSGKIKNNKISVSVPGSKSITARALLIAALSEGESILFGAQFSDDCKTFANCLRLLGVNIETDGTTVRVEGCGGSLDIKDAEINVGSAGTAARFLPAFLAFQQGKFTLDCSLQMKNRPIAPLIHTLKTLGAKFTFLEKENRYPFIIEGTRFPDTEIKVDITESSQFLSAMLISAVCARQTFKITAEGMHGREYVDMTIQMMRAFGAEVEIDDGFYSVGGSYTAKRYDIEPDVSAACYFYAANRILGTEISVKGLSDKSMQGDMKFAAILKNFDGGKIDMSGFSDQALTLAAIAPYFSAPTEIRGIAHIRGQECDRISAIVRNLTAMGIKCEEFADGVKIYPSAPRPAGIETFGDHRVAMAFAVTGLRADGIIIKNAEVCSKTFSGYFSVLDDLCAKMLL